MMNKGLKYIFLVAGLALIGLSLPALMNKKIPAPSSSSVPPIPSALSPSSSTPVSSASSSVPVPVPAPAPISVSDPKAAATSTLAATPAATSTPAATTRASSSVLVIPVPFASQAPLGEWSDERQQDGCEEASVAMAMAWINEEKNITKEEWLVRILALADFEQEKYGEHRDVAIADVVSWMFNDYFSYEKVAIKSVASSSAILEELEQGNIVLIPTNGRALMNPNFKAPGPEEHMILIKGYDYQTGQFITNDPGTRRGENYRYSPSIVFNAIRPYETGYKLPFPKTLVREMIVVGK